ncbi:MAG: hypothetical protein R2781_07070 [Flavobacteriaceae bacterium]
MKFLTLFFSLFFSYNLAVYAQVPTPQGVNNNNSSSGLNWTKTNEYDYVLKENGRQITNVMDLKYLSTNTLAVLDKTSRNVYLLEDFKEAYNGSSGKASLLERNVSKDFYLTNPNSFVFYTDDEYLSGPFVNIDGSYVYYIAEKNATYYLPGIRKFSNWGAKSAQKLEYSSNNTYWCKTNENGYHVVEKGESMDYTNATTEKRGDDLVVKVNGVDKYILPGYYTVATYVFKPVRIASGGNSNPVSNNTTGCVDGDCQNGWGKYEYGNGYYDGFWKNGKKDGYGLYKWDGIGKYIGNWSNDTMNGYGVYIADNNDNIIGEYQNGQLNGLGVTVTGDVWDQGIFSNGNITTHYDFYTTNSETGCTAGDCQNKYGQFKWSNGDVFTGFFKNGKLYMGTYSFASGDKYSGMFNNDNQFHGMGRFFFADNAYYGGQWMNGQYHGKGYYHDKDLVQKIGEWSNGTLTKNLK